MKSALITSYINYIVLFQAKKGIWYNLVIKNTYEWTNFLDSGSHIPTSPCGGEPQDILCASPILH